MQIAVYFGGLGYHCDKPLLYYARKLASQCGYTEFVNVDYTVTVKNIRGDASGMQQAFMQALEQTEEQLAQVDFSKYDKILFVSKSIGTAVAAAYQEKHTEIFKEKEVKNVYLTPLELTFSFQPEKGIAFTGTSDPWADAEIIREKCVECGIDVTVIKNVNHSLEGEDVLQNIAILQEVMKKIQKYCEETE